MNRRTSRKVTFMGHDGSELAALLDQPDHSPRAYALFAHCFTCSKDVFAASRISRALAQLGFAVLRFDFTGLGHSDGEFANTNFSSNVDDLVRAARFLQDEHQGPSLLIGHSLGGAAVLAAADQIPSTAAVVTIGAPAEPIHAEHLIGGARDELDAQGIVEVSIGGRPFTIKKQFIEDLAAHRLAEKVRALRKPLMIFHSPIDKIVGIDQARQIYQAALHPKSFISLDGADHLVRRQSDAEYVAEVISAFAGRHIKQDAADEVEPGRVVVEETGTGKFTQRVSMGRHRWLADEPKSFGGDDRGPSPYDLLLAGLGACTSMTMRMYADRKGLALDSVRVTLAHAKVHAKDCADCETTGGKIDEIDREISITGDLSEAERTRLLEIADRCPVHRTLHSEIKVRTKTA